MNFFSELNKRLDAGWKLTDSNCPICKSSIIYNPTDKSLFCIKCNTPCKMEVDIQDDYPNSHKDQKTTKTQEIQEEKKTTSNNRRNDYYDEEDDDDFDADEFKWNMNKNAPPSRTDEISKLLSQKLLKGYAMLQECCATCLAPIMKSKQGEYTCVGCNWVKTKKEFDAIVEAQESGLSQSTPQQNSQTTTTTQPQQTNTSQQQQQPKTQQPQTQTQVSNTNQAVQNVTQQQQQVQPILNNGEQKNFYSAVQRILNKSAEYYERQIDQFIQQGQTAIVDSIIKGSLTELIKAQQLLNQQ